MEVMLDRKSYLDDARGLNEPLQDNVLTHIHLQLMLEASSAPCTAVRPHSAMPLRPSLLSHHLSTRMNYPPHLFLSLPQKPADVAVAQRTASQGKVGGLQRSKYVFAPMKRPLPCDVHLVSLKVHRPVMPVQVSTWMHLRPGHC